MMMDVRALAGVVMASCASAAEADSKLSGRELLQLFPGTFQAVVNGAMVMSISARGDGSLVGKVLGKSDTGRWAVRADKLCINWKTWLQGRTRCSAVTEDSGWYRGANVTFKKI